MGDRPWNAFLRVDIPGQCPRLCEKAQDSRDQTSYRSGSVRSGPNSCLRRYGTGFGSSQNDLHRRPVRPPRGYEVKLQVRLIKDTSMLGDLMMGKGTLQMPQWRGTSSTSAVKRYCRYRLCGFSQPPSSHPMCQNCTNNHPNHPSATFSGHKTSVEKDKMANLHNISTISNIYPMKGSLPRGSPHLPGCVIGQSSRQHK